jgi:Uma2 family endonuclease
VIAEGKLSTASVQQAKAMLDDLYRTPGKAELIGGRIVRYMAMGYISGRVASRICRGLDDYADQTGVGEAFTGVLGYAIRILPSGRESFSPDASYHKGPFPKNPMRFIEGSPTFAAEVRSENDYKPSALLEMAEKRDDCFQAGTLVVWDVDPTIAECIHVYRAADPENPVTYQRGQMADAEPAVPGWKVAVDRIFE